jgi:Piwi domain
VKREKGAETRSSQAPTSDRSLLLFGGTVPEAYPYPTPCDGILDNLDANSYTLRMIAAGRYRDGRFQATIQRHPLLRSTSYYFDDSEDPPGTEATNIDTTDYDELLDPCQQLCVNKPELMVFLLHQGMDTTIYKIVKNFGEIEGVFPQCMIVEKSVWTKGSMQYRANIALKLNVKLDGVNWTVDEKLFSRPIMMLEGDVSHPHPAELRMVPPPPSYCALCCKYGLYLLHVQYCGCGPGCNQRAHDSYHEAFLELIKRFEGRNLVLPERIFYWRDGLSDS